MPSRVFTLTSVCTLTGKPALAMVPVRAMAVIVISAVVFFIAISSCLPRHPLPLPPPIQRNRGHDHDAGHDLLHPVGQPLLRAADLYHGHERGPHERPEGGALPAEEASPADDHRRDH